jgi:hypothetical protein
MVDEMWIGVDMQTNDRRYCKICVEGAREKTIESARPYGVTAFRCFANASLKRYRFSQLLDHTRGVEINTLRGGWDFTQRNW